MTHDTHCHLCGRPVTPCANCGSTSGHMVRISNHDDGWLHDNKMDCIFRLRNDLDATRRRIAELEARLTDAGQRVIELEAAQEEHHE